MEAAKRVQPQLPACVLERAAELCRSSDDETTNDQGASYIVDKAYLAALAASMEKQKALASAAREQAESYVQDMATCRAAMIDLAKQYDRQLGFWETRVADCYTTLFNDKKDSLELLGETLDDIRVARKRMQSQAQMLRERGLRLLPTDHVLSEGESVVIVGGTWDGAEGTVVVQSTESTKPDSIGKVCVVVSVSPFEPRQVIQLQRHQVAIWDYDSVFDDWDKDVNAGSSREDSKRRLNGILSTLTATANSQTKPPQPTSTSQAYTSSRERKAGKKRKKR